MDSGSDFQHLSFPSIMYRGSMIIRTMRTMIIRGATSSSLNPARAMLWRYDPHTSTYGFCKLQNGYEDQKDTSSVSLGKLEVTFFALIGIPRPGEISIGDVHPRISGGGIYGGAWN